MALCPVSFFSSVFTNVTVTTTRTTFGDLTVAIPSWVDQISVFAIGNFQLTNTSGGDVLMTAAVEIDGQVVDEDNHEAVDNQTQVLTNFAVLNAGGVAGSSISIDLRVVISTGTNTSNRATVGGIIVGTR